MRQKDAIHSDSNADADRNTERSHHDDENEPNEYANCRAEHPKTVTPTKGVRKPSDGLSPSHVFVERAVSILRGGNGSFTRSIRSTIKKSTLIKNAIVAG